MATGFSADEMEFGEIRSGWQFDAGLGFVTRLPGNIAPASCESPRHWCEPRGPGWCRSPPARPKTSTPSALSFRESTSPARVCSVIRRRRDLATPAAPEERTAEHTLQFRQDLSRFLRRQTRRRNLQVRLPRHYPSCSLRNAITENPYSTYFCTALRVLIHKGDLRVRCRNDLLFGNSEQGYLFAQDKHAVPDRRGLPDCARGGQSGEGSSKTTYSKKTVAAASCRCLACSVEHRSVQPGNRQHRGNRY